MRSVKDLVKYYEKFDKSPELGKPSYVYFLVLPDVESNYQIKIDNKPSELFYCKIGTSINPKNRISDLHTAIPFAVKEIIVEHPFFWRGFTAKEFEAGLHRFLDNNDRKCEENDHSREWFLLSENEIEELVSFTEYFASISSNNVGVPFSVGLDKEHDAQYFHDIKRGIFTELSKSFSKKMQIAKTETSYYGVAA